MESNLTLHRVVPLAFALSLSLSISEADAAQNYCQYGSRKIVILVDRTTAYDEVDKNLFKEGFEKIYDSFRIGDRVLVYTIGGDYADSAKTFDQCLPGCPKKGILDWFVGKCRSLEAQAGRTRFKRNLALHIRRMLDDVQEFPHSDIARTIARVTESMAAPSVGSQRHIPLASLFVFSDLIENSDVLPWPAIVTGSPSKSLDALQRHNIAPKVAGAKVFAFGFGRFHDAKRSPLGAALEQKVKSFWHAYFTKAGASQVNIGQRIN